MLGLNKILWEYKEKEDITSKIYFQKLTQHNIRYNPELSVFGLLDSKIIDLRSLALDDLNDLRRSRLSSQDSGFDSGASRTNSTSSKG